MSDMDWVKESLDRIELKQDQTLDKLGGHETRITVIEGAETRRKWWVGIGVTTGMAAIAKSLWG